MPPSIRPHRPTLRRAAGVGVVLAIVVAAGLWWRGIEAPPSSRVAPIETAALSATPAPIPVAVSTPAPVLAASATPQAASPASTAPERAEVDARAAAASQADQEAARMAGYIAFQKTYLQWRALARGDDPARRDALGQQILDGLPAQVRQGDVALQQARSVQEEVLTARIPDTAQRAPVLAQEQQRLPADAHPMAPPQQAFH